MCIRDRIKEFKKIPKKIKLINCVGGGSSAYGFWSEFIDYDKKQIELIDSLQKSGILKIKIYAMIENGPDVDYYINQGPYKTDRLNVRSVKVLADGALGSRGASMIDEYSDRKGYYGLMITLLEH